MKLKKLWCLMVLVIFIQETIAQSTSETSNSKKKVIILSIDGGGIKGVIPAIFMEEIEKQTGKQSYELFDIMGGTSTGGIICTALISKDTLTEKPYKATKIVDMYTQQGKDLFIAQKRGRKLIKAKYYADCEGKGIEPFLQKAFGSTTTLRDSYNFIQNQPNARLQQVFTTTYVVNSTGGAIKEPRREVDYGPYLFNWQQALKYDSVNYYVWEAARCTSSAPVFFPIANVGGGQNGRSNTAEKWAVDGGVMSNNPSMWGISESFRNKIAKELEEIVVISIGCGFNPASAGVGIHGEGWEVPRNGNWGEASWILEPLVDLGGNKNSGGTIVNLMLESVQMAPNNQLESFAKVLPIKYFRLEPYLPPSQSAMDNTSKENIDALMKTAKDYLQSSEGKEKMTQILEILKAE